MIISYSLSNSIIDVGKLVFIDFCNASNLVVIIQRWLPIILRLFLNSAAQWLPVIVVQLWCVAITLCGTFLDLHKETRLEDEFTSRSPQWNELYP